MPIVTKSAPCWAHSTHRPWTPAPHSLARAMSRPTGGPTPPPSPHPERQQQTQRAGTPSRQPPHNEGLRDRRSYSPAIGKTTRKRPSQPKSTKRKSPQPPSRPLALQPGPTPREVRPSRAPTVQPTAALRRSCAWSPNPSPNRGPRGANGRVTRTRTLSNEPTPIYPTTRHIRAITRQQRGTRILVTPPRSAEPTISVPSSARAPARQPDQYPHLGSLSLRKAHAHPLETIDPQTKCIGPNKLNTLNVLD